jgi:uncharacterized protein YdaU (DUF1376 family)
MPLAARGAYIDLLCYQWEEESIPDDQGEIALMLGVSAKEISAIWKHIERAFPLCEDGARRNQRVSRDRDLAHAFCERQKANGSRGGRPSKTQNNPPVNSGITQTEPKKSQPEPEPEPIVNTLSLFPCATGNDRQAVVEILIGALPETHRTPEVEAAIRKFSTMRAENAARDAVGWRPWGITSAETLGVQWGKHPIAALLAALETATASQWKNLRFDLEPVPHGRSRASPPAQESAEQRAKRRLEQVGIRQ